MQATRKPYNYDPKKSKVYMKSLSFAKGLYDISESFPDAVIQKKIRNLAVSIATYISQSRVTMYHANEFNYLNDAMKCISQCRSLIDLALVRDYITFEQYQKTDIEAVELLKISFSLIKGLKHYGTNIEVNKWRVEDFRQSHLYNCSIDLMQSIYWLVDSVDINIDFELAEKAYRLAINTPLFIASGIGQLNMKVRIKKFNDSKENLEELNVLLKQFDILFCDKRRDLNAIEDCRIQVVKLLNNFFGRLKSSNVIEQVE